MSEVAHGPVRARPIPICRRIESSAESDYHVKIARNRAMQMMAADARDVVSRIMNTPGYDNVTKLNLINRLK